MAWWTLILAAALAACHLAASRLRFLDVVPRSRWLSAFGGVTVAYVFVHLLPEVAERNEHLVEATEGVISWFEHHAWLLALVGFTAFYGLERLVRRARSSPATGELERDAPGNGVFWLHIASFAIYNALVGYLLVEQVSRPASGGDERNETISVVLFTVAMGLHFLINDYGLQQHHRGTYRSVGRWLLAAAVLVGWVLGQVIMLAPAAIAVILALIAGGVILNVIKEELPEDRESRWWAFAAGAVAYAALLLAV